MQRKIFKTLNTRSTVEGAGVHLNRVFGYEELPLLDPFLLLDDFSSSKPEDYAPGFPWHPHRGIETVTYIIEGNVRHKDSMKNEGVISSGDIQWMTAGSGIIHEEMPQPYHGEMKGFQLWVNIPASGKMMDPRYQEVRAKNIPEVRIGKDVHAKVICGQLEGSRGPVEDLLAEPFYFDVAIEPGGEFHFPVTDGHKVFAYIFRGHGTFADGADPVGAHSLIVYENSGNEVGVQAGGEGLRFLFVSGKPLGEPVAWYGPIVMNTKEELQHAFQELQVGTFVKKEGRHG